MGASCATCVGNKKALRHSNYEFSTYPDDFSYYESQVKVNLPKFKFHGLLYNIRILNYPKQSVSLKFDLLDIKQIFIPCKSKTKNSNQIKWLIKQNFDFAIDEYQLRRKFLNITVIDDSTKNYQTIRMNLYKIATGPFHNDLCLLKAKQNIRLQFDLKISQYVQIKADCLETSVSTEKKEYPGESFYFTIRILREEKEEPFQSNPSYSLHNSYQQTKRAQILPQHVDECISPIKIRANRPNKMNSNFVWDARRGVMPQFKILLKSYQIQKTVLHIVVWRNQNQVEYNKSQNTHEEDGDMFCQSYTPIIKLLQTQKQSSVKFNESNNIKREQNIINLVKQGLWSDGQKMGQVSMKIRVQNNLFIKQMKACTRTQLGIIQSVPFLHIFAKSNKNQNYNEKFRQVNQTMNKIYDLNKQINQNNNLSNIGVQKLKNTMLQHFYKILKFYEQSQQQSFFVSKNQNELAKMINDQEQLISIVSQLLGFSQDDEQLTEVCWQIIITIMRRGEFNLNNIGFKNDLVDLKKIPSSLYKQKVRIGLQYQQILNKLLLISIRQGYIQGRKDSRQNMQIFRAFCYFRVPEYRQILLRKVVKKQDQTIQWNTNITDGNVQALSQTQNIMHSQLDWENWFYKPLELQIKSQQLNKQLVESLEGSLWLQQISKRGNTFFYFLYFLISRLSELNKKIKYIKWQYYPGYNKLVRAFLFQMKNIKVQNYPQSLIQTSIYLLANQKLLNILMCIVFQKTNPYDCNVLMKGLDLIGRYLNHFTKKQKLLPTTFNYVYFFKGLKIIFQGQFSFAIVKALSIIYVNYQNFNVEFKKTLSLYLLGRVFFKLFLNWSFTVRNAFYHTLILKILKSVNIFNAQSRKQFANKTEVMNQIKGRYDLCLSILKNASQIHNQQKSLDHFKKHQKQLFKVLKRRLVNKRKRNSMTIQKKKSTQSNSAMRQNGNNINGYFGSDRKKKNQYSIFQLLRNTNNQRTQSLVIENSIFSFSKENDQKQGRESLQQIQQMTKIKSFSISIPQQQNLSNSNLKTPAKRLRERKRSIFGNQDFDIRQLDQKEIEYIHIALKQYDNLYKAIEKFRMENNSQPVCQLEVEVPIDQKQIKPDSADFQQWEGGQDD